jgi:hypothetical protein
MEPEGSLPYSQEPSTGPYPEDPVHTMPPYLSKVKSIFSKVMYFWTLQQILYIPNVSREAE